MSPRALVLYALLAACTVGLLLPSAEGDARLAGGFRSPEKAGWIPVRLAGTPEQIGYQHGALLAAEIEDAVAASKLNMTHDGHSWEFYRKAAMEVLWPGVDEEYRAELKGMAEALAAKGVKLDVTDLLVHNASLEFSYYTAWKEKTGQGAAQERCSALIATGSVTEDHQIVIAHNNWSGYLEGERWKVIFDIRPAQGHRILMDGMPGLIHSGDDFGMNDAGLVITETTITGFQGFDPKGKPEFVRARKAMQYATSIDEFYRIMTTGNNGGYANAWMVGDVKTNEVARLELGLKNVTLERTKDGYFTGANFPINEKLLKEETTFDAANPQLSANARRVRWEQVMGQIKGHVDLEKAQKAMGDHFDAYENRADAPGERTLCGHVELSERGMGAWWGPYGPAGTVQNKAATGNMVKAMMLSASLGHSCGIPFRAVAHLKAHAEYRWLSPLLKDIPAQPWALFQAK